MKAATAVVALAGTIIAAVAHAQVPWVLWSVSTPPSALHTVVLPDRWEIVGVHDTKDLCEQALRRAIREYLGSNYDLAQGFRSHVCYPSGTDPKGTKYRPQVQ